jgi:hypothetical protein
VIPNGGAVGFIRALYGIYKPIPKMKILEKKQKSDLVF